VTKPWNFFLKKRHADIGVEQNAEWWSRNSVFSEKNFRA